MTLRRLVSRFLALFKTRRLDRELEDEIQAHLELAERDAIAAGLLPEDARLAATRAFGGVARAKELHRETRSFLWIDHARQDVRYAVRTLAKNPGFVVLAVLTLTLGIGANTALFSVVNGVLLRPLPYPDADRVVRLWSSMLERGFPQSQTSMPDYRALVEHSRTVEDIGAYTHVSYNITGGDQPERVRAVRATASLFKVLEMSPLLGSWYPAAAEQWGEHRVALVGEALWRRRFGAAPAVIGQQVSLDDESYTIIGVVPLSFRFPDSETEIWTPLSYPPSSNLNTRDSYFLDMVARLRPGVSLTQARSELTAIVKAVNPSIGVETSGLRESIVGDVSGTLFLLSGAVVLVLLIACANVANLLLTRAVHRHKELTLRLALGASRGRVLRQLFAESLVLGFAGGASGLLFAVAGVDVLNQWAPPGVLRLGDVHVDTTVLGFTFGLVLVTGLGFGLLPMAALSKAELAEPLKHSTRGTSGRAQDSARNLLVIAEMAFSLVLLIGASLFIVSLVRLQHLDPGFKVDNVLTLRLDLPELRYGKPEVSTSFVRQTVEHMRTLPGVTAAGATTALPLSEGGSGRVFAIEGQPAPRSFAEVPVVRYRQITPDYFKVLQVSLKQGRFFSERDEADQPGVAIVNETFVRRFLPNARALDALVYLGPHEALTGGRRRFPRLAIVGIVSDVRHTGLDQEVQPEIFVPHAQAGPFTGRSLYVVVRTESVAAREIAAEAQQVVRNLDSNLPISRLLTMEELLWQSMAERRFTMSLLALFAVTALTLAGVGIYGVISYSIGQRRSEMGIRLALGAQPVDVVRLIVVQGARLAVIAVGLGLAIAVALARSARSLLFDVEATEPSVYAAMILLLLSVAVLGSYVPASRAAKVDPMMTLRQE
jgi:predicted permease